MLECVTMFPAQKGLYVSIDEHQIVPGLPLEPKLLTRLPDKHQYRQTTSSCIAQTDYRRLEVMLSLIQGLRVICYLPAVRCLLRSLQGAHEWS